MPDHARARALTSDPVPNWRQRFLARIVHLWWLKSTGTAAFMVLFFQAYFWVLKNPSGEAFVLPLLAPDRWIAFEPLGFYPYAWLWVYVSLAPALIPNWLALLRYGFWVGLMCALCLAIFWLWPTQTPAFDIHWADYPRLAFLKGIDAASNACPSLHVAAALHAACWLHRQLNDMGAPAWTRWFSALQCAAIVWATMAIRQHVFIDVLSGAAVGLLFAWLSMRWERPALTASAAVPARC